jgi:hypothetical protein
MDYIPLVTHDYKLSFVRATNELPEELQRIIWEKIIENTEPVAPAAPKKKPIKPSPRLARLMKNWSARRQI